MEPVAEPPAAPRRIAERVAAVEGAPIRIAETYAVAGAEPPAAAAAVPNPAAGAGCPCASGPQRLGRLRAVPRSRHPSEATPSRRTRARSWAVCDRVPGQATGSAETPWAGGPSSAQHRSRVEAARAAGPLPVAVRRVRAGPSGAPRRRRRIYSSDRSWRRSVDTGSSEGRAQGACRVGRGSRRSELTPAGVPDPSRQQGLRGAPGPAGAICPFRPERALPCPRAHGGRRAGPCARRPGPRPRSFRGVESAAERCARRRR